MPLLDFGWSEEQAKGLFDSLRLTGSVPDWKHERLQKLYEWCSAHEKDHKTIDAQLEFVAYELCNVYEGTGMALKRAKTVDEASQAVQPYIKRLMRE
jgi:Phage tail lysozyme